MIELLACGAVVVLCVRELRFTVAWLSPSLKGMVLALLLSRVALGYVREARSVDMMGAVVLLVPWMS